MLALVAALARHRRWLVAGALAGALIAASWSLVVTEQYASSTSFAPGDAPASSLPSGLAALGSRFGAAFSLNEGSRSLQFYAQVLVGHDLLSAIARDTFSAPKLTQQPSQLIALLHQRGADSAETLDNTIQYLQDRVVRTDVNDRTGIVTLTVVLPDPRLAAAVATRLYGRLEAFNYQMRRSGAAERRRFAERELAASRSRLDEAESALRDFLERNRAGLASPRLALEQQRLQRQIDVAQIAYGQMTQELTEARIAEARDTPVFTVVERAVPPARRSFPHRTRMTLVGALAGIAIVVLVVAVREAARHTAARDPRAFGELRSALRWRRRRSHSAS